MDTTDTVNVTRAGEGEHWLFGADVTTIKASGRHTSGDLLVLEVTAAAGGGPPSLHRHEYTEIFAVNLDGTALQQLTNNTARDFHPVFSPDGRKIVFETNKDGNFEIYEMRTDGTNPVNLTDHPAADLTPDWQPLEKQV